MTLLITVFASIAATVVWYMSSERRTLKLGTLALIYWGASIMWFVDAVFEFLELRDEFFTPSRADMLNDSFLGLCVVALGLIIWLVIVLVNDPKGVVRSALSNKNT